MEPFRNDGMSGGLQRHQQRVGPTLGCCWGIPLGSLNGTVFLEGCRETSAATCRVKCWGPPFFKDSCMKFGLVSLGKNRINSSACGVRYLGSLWSREKNQKHRRRELWKNVSMKLGRKQICNTPIQPIQDGPLPVIHGLKKDPINGLLNGERPLPATSRGPLCSPFFVGRSEAFSEREWNMRPKKGSIHSGYAPDIIPSFWMTLILSWF